MRYSFLKLTLSLLGWGCFYLSPVFASSEVKWNIAAYFSSESQKLENDRNKVEALKQVGLDPSAAPQDDMGGKQISIYFDHPLPENLFETMQFKNGIQTYYEKKDSQNSGSLETFQNFLEKAFVTRSEFNVLILSGHGTLWLPESLQSPYNLTYSSFGTDEGAENDSLTLLELKEALKRLPQKLDLLIFDACNMANIETLYQIKDFVKYVVATPFNLETEALSYAPFGDVFLTPLDLGKALIQRSFNPTLPDNMGSFFLYDLNEIGTLVEDFSPKIGKSEILRNPHAADYFSLTHDIKILDFVIYNPVLELNLWIKELPYLTDLSEHLKDNRLGKLKNQLLQYAPIITETLQKKIPLPKEYFEDLDLYRLILLVQDQPETLNYSGLSIFFPKNIHPNIFERQLNFYRELDFSQKTKWGETLQDFFLRKEEKEINIPLRPDAEETLIILNTEGNVKKYIEIYNNYIDALIDTAFLYLSNSFIENEKNFSHVYIKIKNVRTFLTLHSPNNFSYEGAKVFLLRYKILLAEMILIEWVVRESKVAEYSGSPLVPLAMGGDDNSEKYIKKLEELEVERETYATLYDMMFEKDPPYAELDQEFWELVPQILGPWLW